MRYQPSLVVSYLVLLLNQLQWEDSFYRQVRAIESLASILYELGDEDAKRIAQEAVKYEAEAYIKIKEK